MDPMDIYLSETKMYGAKPWRYQVWVDGRIYDEFDSVTALTWAQQDDVAGMYRDALTGYTAPTLAA